MQSNGPIQSSSLPSALQQAEGFKSKGYETESLIVKQGGKDLKLEVSRQKGRFGARFIRKLASKFVPKLAQARAEQKKQAVEIIKSQVSDSKFAEYRDKGKISVAEAVPWLKQAKQTEDFSKMPYEDLVTLARNPDASNSLREKALENIGEFKADVFDTDAGCPPAGRIRQQQTDELKKEGFSEEQIEQILKGFGKAIGIDLAPAQAPKPTPDNQISKEVNPEAEASPEISSNNTPEEPIYASNIGSLKALQLQRLADDAVTLASSGDQEGLNELLQSTRQYSKIELLSNQLKSQLGEDNPAYKQSFERLTELKPQELVNQAHKAEIYDSFEVRQFAAEALVQEDAFSAVTNTILDGVYDIVNPAPELPPRTDDMHILDEPETSIPSDTKVESEKASDTVQAPPLQQLTDNALTLARSGDSAGLNELLKSSSEYKEIQHVRNEIKSQLGKNNPAFKSAMSRLVELKPQDLIMQAQLAGHTEPSEIKQFAAEAIAKEKGYSKITGYIMQSVNAQVDNSHSPPPISESAKKPNTSRPTAESIQEKLYAEEFTTPEELIGEIYSMNSLSELQALDEWVRESYDDLDLISEPLRAIQDEIIRLSPTFRPPLPPRDGISVRR